MLSTSPHFRHEAIKPEARRNIVGYIGIIIIICVSIINEIFSLHSSLPEFPLTFSLLFLVSWLFATAMRWHIDLPCLIHQKKLLLFYSLKAVVKNLPALSCF